MTQRSPDRDAWRRLLDLAFETGTPRNTIVYSAAITACEKAREWRHAMDLLSRMQVDGVESRALIEDY